MDMRDAQGELSAETRIWLRRSRRPTVTECPVACCCPRTVRQQRTQRTRYMIISLHPVDLSAVWGTAVTESSALAGKASDIFLVCRGER